MCTIGRIPASASPPPTLTMSCSLMPTLSTRSGCLAAALPNMSEEISASTTAASGSSSSSADAVSAKTVRISGITTHSFPSTVATTSCGPADAAPAAVTRNADASASWSRPETRTADHPLTAKCASIPPGPQP